MYIKIGERIEEVVKSKRIQVPELAKALGTERSNIYNIFRRRSIDTDLLKKIGQYVEYDFFQDLLEPETVKKIAIKENVKKSKIFLEIDLSEDEIIKIGFDEKILKILKK